MTHPDRAIEAGARALCLATFGDKTVHGDARCCQAGGTDGCCIQEVKPLAKACIDAALAAEGLVLMPIEPTPSIIKAYIAADPRRKRYAATAKRDYRAMLAAAQEQNDADS